jgi:predicted metalloprotease
MKKVLAIALSLMLAFPAASLMAQQAPAKVQPAQVAYQGGPEGGVMGMSMGTAIAVAVAVVVVAVAANDSNDVIPGTTAASGTR